MYPGRAPKLRNLPAKVAQFRVIFRIEQDVLGLDVPVQDVFLV